MITVEKVSRWVAKPRGRGGRSKVMYEARLGDMTVDGNTSAEAKAAILEMAGDMMKGDYTPVVIRPADQLEWIAFIYRTSGTPKLPWCYKLIGHDFDGRQKLHGMSGYASAEEAEAKAMSHLAQNVFDARCPLDWIDLIEDHDARNQFLHWATYQVRHHALVEAGFDGRMHETAGGLDRWPEHIDKPADLVDPKLVPAHG